MAGPLPMQAVVIAQAAITKNSEPMQLALFNADGTPYDPTMAADLSDFLEADQMPVQAASVAADVAAMVVDFNDLLTKLKTAGLMASA